MDKQLEQLSKLFEYLGIEDPSALATSFLTPGEGKEPELPIDNILKQAQSYAMPHLRTSLKKEFNKEAKGQYTNEFINKVIALSDGALKRADFDHLGDGDDNFQRALTSLLEHKGAKPQKQDDSETAKKLKEAIDKISEWENKYNTDTASIRAEYEEKENDREFYEYLMEQLGSLKGADGKSKQELLVDLQHAAKMAKRDIYDLAKPRKVDGKWGLYDKENLEAPYTDGTKSIGVMDIAQNTIKTNNWLKQSNGGSSNAQQFMSRPNQQNNNNSGGQQQGHQGNRTGLRQQVEQVTGNAA